ncbi:MAG: RNA-binding domain-containing protein [Solirubrobacterales bacterium]
MLTVEELESALHAGYEGRGFELKGPGRSDDKRFLAKIARAALSMGNLRDGGHVVIGIDDEKPQDMLPGLNGDELATWLAYDDVSGRLAAYCDPPISFDLVHLTVATGVSVVVVQVHEFADIPHLCAREYPDVLRAGALYIRSRKMPETAEVASSVEMREILDLAAQKRLRAYIEMAERAGVGFSIGESGAAGRNVDSKQFEQQVRRVWDD